MLQQAAQQQKSALEHQANALLLEYNQKKAQEDLLFQQYQFQKQHYEIQLKYNDEMRNLQSAGDRPAAGRASAAADCAAGPRRLGAGATRPAHSRPEIAPFGVLCSNGGVNYHTTWCGPA